MVVQCEREARIKAEAKHDAVRLAAQQESQVALRAQHSWTSEKEATCPLHYTVLLTNAKCGAVQ